MTAIRSVTLHCTTNGSYKSYKVELIETAAGYLVNTQHGRIGGPQKPGTKTPQPVDLSKATKAFDKLVAEKQRGGYEICDSAGAPAATPAPATAAASAALPERVDLPIMLLNPIDSQAAAALIADPAWGMETKFDGERRLICIEDGRAYGLNRRGVPIKLSAEILSKIESGLGQFSGRTVIDGEDLGATYCAFDVLAFDGLDITDKSFAERIAYRARLRERLPALCYASTAISSEAKRRMFDGACVALDEGVVFKRMDAPYRNGRPNSGGNALKHKFVETASFKVVGTHPTKRSIRVALHDGIGTWTEVGNVTIPPNHDVPAAGDVVEVAYLYAFRGGSIYQPVYRGRRDDIGIEDCLLAQLKYVQDRATDLPQAA